MNFMKDNKELLLVHTSMPRVALSQDVNVMVTPQFYTLKKEMLPLKYAYQAKKIAPSLFEGLLEEGGTYDYVVKKEEEGWWSFIAYDINKITAFLESKGITSEKVSKLFFAQEAVESFIAPLALGEKEALVVLDGTVVVVPRMALGSEEEPALAFDGSFTPKGGISIGSSASVITQKQAFMLAGVFVFFGLLFALEASRYGMDSQGSQGEIERLYESYPALQSSYTRQSIVEKYKGIDSSERKKRDAIKAFSGMIFKGVTLRTLHVDDKGFKAEFSCSDAKVAKRLKALAKEAHYNTTNLKGSNDLRIEGLI